MIKQGKVKHNLSATGPKLSETTDVELYFILPSNVSKHPLSSDTSDMASSFPQLLTQEELEIVARQILNWVFGEHLG